MQQKESKVLRQQLRQVKWNNRATGRAEERRGELAVDRRGGGRGGEECRRRRKGLK